MGADYTFYVKTIETHARAFLTLNILIIGRVEKSREIADFQKFADNYKLKVLTPLCILVAIWSEQAFKYI